MKIKSLKLPFSKGSRIQNGQAVGVDITSKAIYSVLLSGNSVTDITLEKYAVTPLPDKIINAGVIEDHDQLVVYLQHAMKDLGTSCKNLIFAMPQHLTTIQTFEYDEGKTELDIDEFIELELSKSTPLENIRYDFFSLPDSILNGGNSVEVIVASSAKDEVDLRVDILHDAHIEPKKIDTEVIAIMNAFTTWMNGSEHADKYEDICVALFQINYHNTTAIICKSGHILYRQEINLGLQHLVELTRRQYQITEESAWGIVLDSEKPDDFSQKVDKLFQEQLLQEIQRLLQFYYATNTFGQNITLDQIFISGYTNSDNSLSSYLKQQLKITVDTINPIDIAKAGSNIDLATLRNHAGLLTVAFGLAVRGL